MVSDQSSISDLLAAVPTLLVASINIGCIYYSYTAVNGLFNWDDNSIGMVRWSVGILLAQRGCKLSALEVEIDT